MNNSSLTLQDYNDDRLYTYQVLAQSSPQDTGCGTPLTRKTYYPHCRYSRLQARGLAQV